MQFQNTQLEYNQMAFTISGVACIY